jgi:putative endopeptidase
MAAGTSTLPRYLAGDMTVRIVLGLALAVCVAGCRPTSNPAPVVDGKPEQTAEAIVPEAVGLEPVDTKLDPCDDFYRYACGPWLAENPRPAESMVHSRSFSNTEAVVQERVHALLDEIATTSDPSLAPLGELWRLCMDEPGRVAAGLGSLEPMWTAIDTLQPRRLADVVGMLHAHGVPALFRVRRVDSAGTWRLGLGSAGLGPASMYASEEPRLAAYHQHMAEMFQLAQLDAPHHRAYAVIAFETALAALQPTRDELIAEQRSAPAPRPLASVRKEARSFDWDRYLTALGQPEPAQVLVPPNRFAALVSLLGETDIRLLRDYLRWQVLHHTATILPPAFASEHQRMFDPEAAAAGPESSCVRQVEATFGPLVGRAYIDRHVAPEDRARVRGLVDRMLAQLRVELERAAWIDAPSRDTLLAYLDRLTISVAEPQPPAPLTGAEESTTTAAATTAGDFLATALARRRMQIAAELDGTAQQTLPVTSVNGQMSSGAVTLYAGLMQPPLYSRELSEPVLLGAIGMIVAHELGHVLDPGTLAQEVAWTPTPATAAAYAERRQCIADSYARAEVGPGLHVDGEMVAVESFADNLGLRLAHALVQASDRSAQQQFFVSMAQMYCTDYQPEMLELAVQFDVAPAPLRVNQPLRLYPGFASAFACAEGTPMHPADACSPW